MFNSNHHNPPAGLSPLDLYVIEKESQAKHARSANQFEGVPYALPKPADETDKSQGWLIGVLHAIASLFAHKQVASQH